MRLARAIRLLPRCWGDNSLAQAPWLHPAVQPHARAHHAAEPHRRQPSVGLRLCRTAPETARLAGPCSNFQRQGRRCQWQDWRHGRHVLDKIVHDLPIRQQGSRSRRHVDRRSWCAIRVQTIREHSGGSQVRRHPTIWMAPAITTRPASHRPARSDRTSPGARVFYMDSEALLDRTTAETLAALSSRYLGIAPRTQRRLPSCSSIRGDPSTATCRTKIMAGPDRSRRGLGAADLLAECPPICRKCGAFMNHSGNLPEQTREHHVFA
jgi:hypothetical protein